jgi:hypothetical protein
VTPLDYDAVLRLLKKRGIPADCPICSANEWQVLGPLENLLGAIPVADLEGEHVSMGKDWTVLLAFALVCRKCGFIRLHSRKALTEFAREAGEHSG